MTLSATIYGENWIFRAVSHLMAWPTSACDSNNLVSIGAIGGIGKKLCHCILILPTLIPSNS